MNRYCRVCQKESKTKLLYNEDNYDIIRCNVCGFISTDPIPTPHELEEFYSTRYYSGEETQAKAYRNSRTRPFIQTLKVIKERNISKQDIILDIGCGYGAFLRFGTLRDFMVEGIDISRSAIKYVRERLHLEAWHGELGKLPLPNDRYKAVTMLDVLEHLPDFMEKLRVIHDLLKPNGLIYIRSPNMNLHLIKLRIFKFLGVKWRYGMFSPPGHLNHFTPAILRQTMERAGFQIEIMLNGAPAWNGGAVRKLGLIIIGCMAGFIHSISESHILIGASMVIVGRKQDRGPCKRQNRKDIVTT